MTTPESEHVERVYERGDGAESEAAYVFVTGEADGTLTLWRYTESGFLDVVERPTGRFAAAVDGGEWVEVGSLPDRVLAAVSGDEVPYEPGD